MRERRSGRPPGPSARARRLTEERILDGARRAVSRHGVAKLAMSDVSRYAGVSRGTAYRYFPGTDALLRELGRREAERFEREVWRAVEAAPPEARLDALLEALVRMAQENPLLRRLPETDPAVVLESTRDRYVDIRGTIGRLLAPQIQEMELVRRGVVRADQLVDWTTRFLISAFLFPDPDPRAMADGLKALYRSLAPERAGAPGRRR